MELSKKKILKLFMYSFHVKLNFMKHFSKVKFLIVGFF